MIKYELEKVIVTFLEVKEGDKPFFMKRPFKNKERARKFVSDLLGSDRKIANIQFKINYNVTKEVLCV